MNLSVKYKGKPVSIDGQEYILPSMSARVVERLMEMEKAGDVWQQYGVMLELIYVTLKRNYPELTLEELKDKVEAVQVNDLFRSLLEASGMAKTDPNAVSP